VGGDVLPFEVAVTPKHTWHHAAGHIGWQDFDGMLTNQTHGGPLDGTFSPHPKVCPESHELFFFSKNSLEDQTWPYATFGRIDEKGRPVQHFYFKLHDPPPAFIHDMFLTRQYAVLIDTSLRMDPQRLWSMFPHTYWNATQPLRFGFFPRDAKHEEDIKWVETKGPGFIWNTVGTYTTGKDKVTLIAPKYDVYPASVPVYSELEPVSYLTAFHVDLLTGHVDEERLLDRPYVSRPITHPNMTEPQFVYMRADEPTEEGTVDHAGRPVYRKSPLGRTLIKVDLNSKQIVNEMKCRVLMENCEFGEPYFVPKKNATDEDDGWLMDIIWSEREETSRFTIWDAKTFDPTPVFTVKVPYRVPYGTHGLWIDRDHWIKKDPTPSDKDCHPNCKHHHCYPKCKEWWAYQDNHNHFVDRHEDL